MHIPASRFEVRPDQAKVELVGGVLPVLGHLVGLGVGIPTDDTREAEPTVFGRVGQVLPQRPPVLGRVHLDPIFAGLGDEHLSRPHDAVHRVRVAVEQLFDDVGHGLLEARLGSPVVHGALDCGRLGDGGGETNHLR